MNEDKEIYQNITLVTEKLFIALFLMGLGFIACWITIFFTPDPNYFYWSVSLLVCGLISIYNYNIIITIKKVDKSTSLIDSLCNSQIMVFLFHAYTIYSFISNLILEYEDYSQLHLVNEVLVINLVTTLYISNYPKLLTTIITYSALLYYTIARPEYYEFRYLLWIHIYLIIFFAFTIVSQLVLNNSLNESRERVRLSYVNMHDLRNKVYSISYLKSNIDNDNDQRSIEEYDTTMKFITNKISFLYHIELIFDYNYTIKNSYINCKNMIEQIADTMKSIFMFKNTTISIKFLSHLKSINIDYHIYEYLIVNLTKFFHDNKNENIHAKIIINGLANLVLIRMQFKIKQVTPELIRRFDKMYIFNKLIQSLKKGSTWNYFYDEESITYDIVLTKEKLNFLYTDPDSTEYSSEMSNLTFCYSVQDDIINANKSLSYIYDIDISVKERNARKFSARKHTRIEKTSSDFSFEDLPKLDLTNVNYKCDMNILYINVDDEYSVLRMNKRVFSKDDLYLNTCIDRFEFLNLLGKLHDDMSNNVINKDLKIIAFIDHIVDCDLGYLIVEQAQIFNDQWDMDIYFVLLSSSYGKDTTDLYSQRGVNEFVTKPLTKLKLKRVIKNVLGVDKFE